MDSQKLFLCFEHWELVLATIKHVNNLRKSVGCILGSFLMSIEKCVSGGGYLFTSFFVVKRRPLKHHHNELYSQVPEI